MIQTQIQAHIPAQTQAQAQVSVPSQAKDINSISGEQLLSHEYPSLSFSIDNILPSGIFILAGSAKIGKSWLSLDMCCSVANGTPLWGNNAQQGKVLYLALEDNYQRLQHRLKTVTKPKTEGENVVNDLSKLYFSTTSLSIDDGLIEQVKSFLDQNTGTKLIVIDTLEKIRNSSDNNSAAYQSDYKDMDKLRAITDNFDVTILLIHHTRKMYDPDPLNMLTGSTGLIGSVDGVWVLQKEARIEDKAKLTIVNRDTKEYCYNLAFNRDDCRWNFLGNYENDKDDGEILCDIIDKLLDKTFVGTATELCYAISNMDNSFETNNFTITKKLNSIQPLLKSKYNIDIAFKSGNGKRTITINRI